MTAKVSSIPLNGWIRRDGTKDQNIKRSTCQAELKVKRMTKNERKWEQRKKREWQKKKERKESDKKRKKEKIEKKNIEKKKKEKWYHLINYTNNNSSYSYLNEYFIHIRQEYLIGWMNDCLNDCLND